MAEPISTESLTFDAGYLARGWLSVAQAASKDKDRPALNKTLLVEFYGDGVRLVATDSYMLLTCWVASKDFGDNPAPALDEAPLRTVVAIDEMGRAKGLFHYLLGLIRQGDADDPPEIPVSLHVGPAPDIQGPALIFDGLGGRECLTIAAEDREALLLDVYEGSYPQWRGAATGWSGVETDVVALPSDLLGRLAAVGKLHDKPLRWSFGGEDAMAKVEVDGAPAVIGFVMPVRWTGRDVVGVSPVPIEDDEAHSVDTDQPVVANQTRVVGRITDPALQPLDMDLEVGARVTYLTEFTVGAPEYKDGPLGRVKRPQLIVERFYDPTGHEDELMGRLAAENEAALEVRAAEIIGESA